MPAWPGATSGSAARSPPCCSCWASSSSALYLGQSNPGQAFGAAGSLAVLLVWVYYSSMILLFGAEFTQLWAERKGQGIAPERGAMRVVRQRKELREGTQAA